MPNGHKYFCEENTEAYRETQGKFSSEMNTKSFTVHVGLYKSWSFLLLRFYPKGTSQ